MGKYYVNYGNYDNTEIDIEVIKRPIVPFPTRRYTEIEIKGHDGKYYKDEETYDDITFSIEFNFVENDLDNIRERFRQVQAWLDEAKEEDNKLTLSDDDNYCYKVYKAEIDNISYADIYEIQSFSITFTVEAFKYLVFGQREKLLTTAFLNSGGVSKPTYRIVGNGNCVFNINGIIVNCVVNGELIINTEYDKILNKDKTIAINKTDIVDMADLYLIAGRNNFSWSSGFKIYITSNIKTI